MTKSKKVVKYFAIFQLLLGVLITCACFSGILIPYFDIIKVSGVDYKMSQAILDEYPEKFEVALNKDFPDYKNPQGFWDKFQRLVIYDVLIGRSEVSFCIKRNYKLWGISLGKLEKVEEFRYSVDFADNLQKVKEDINIGTICTENRVIKRAESSE